MPKIINKKITDTISIDNEECFNLVEYELKDTWIEKIGQKIKYIFWNFKRLFRSKEEKQKAQKLQDDLRKAFMAFMKISTHYLYKKEFLKMFIGRIILHKSRIKEKSFSCTNCNDILPYNMILCPKCRINESSFEVDHVLIGYPSYPWDEPRKWFTQE